MPPAMPNPAKRMTANPARPVARYRPGKHVAEKESSDEEEESEEEQQQKLPQRKPQQARPQPARAQAPRQEESENEDEEGFVTDEEDGTGAPAPKLSALPVEDIAATRRPHIKQGVSQKESDDEVEDESEEESEEESVEESSEEEAPQRKFQRPTFIKKSERKASASTPAPFTEVAANGTPAPDPEIDTQTRRLAQAELLIKDKLERDVLARSQGRKAWDDDGEVLPESMVDDTDGLDPEAEYQAWKLRELKRLKRDREALIAREKEIEETERRRNLTAEEREREDKTFLEKQKADREENRHEASYLARYHHKGAFFQGDETAEILKRERRYGGEVRGSSYR